MRYAYQQFGQKCMAISLQPDKRCPSGFYPRIVIGLDCHAGTGVLDYLAHGINTVFIAEMIVDNFATRVIGELTRASDQDGALSFTKVVAGGLAGDARIAKNSEEIIA